MRSLPGVGANRVAADHNRCAALGLRCTAFGFALGAAMALSPTAEAVEIKLSGQVNRALMWADDGTRSETHHVDNDISSTRFRFVGSEEPMPGFRAGVLFEVEMQSNASDQVTQTDKSISPELEERHINVFFEGGFGKLTLGQTSGAADGGTEVDLSGTDIVQGALGASALGGGIQFLAAGAAGPSIGASISNQDFESRYDQLRYDTPAFGPVKLALSAGVKDDVDTKEAALWYSGSLAGRKLAGALGFSRQSAAGGDDEVIGGSVSWLAASGLNLTLAASKRETPRERRFGYVKVGYKSGKHAVAIDYAFGKDQAASGDEADMIGVGYVYTPVKWAELYAGAKSYGLDRPGSDFDDVRIITVGARLKFQHDVPD